MFGVAEDEDTMTDQERRHVADLLAAHEALIHWCETLITAHADRVELQAWVGGEDRDSVD